MIRRPPRSTQSRSSAASDVYKRQMNARRVELAHRYLAGLSGVPGIDLPEVVPYAHVHSWHLFIVKITGVDRDAVIGALAERNVGVGLHFPPCHLLSYVRERFGARDGDLPDTCLL